MISVPGWCSNLKAEDLSLEMKGMAKELGIIRPTLYSKLKKYDI